MSTVSLALNRSSVDVNVVVNELIQEMNTLNCFLSTSEGYTKGLSFILRTVE